MSRAPTAQVRIEAFRAACGVTVTLAPQPQNRFAPPPASVPRPQAHPAAAAAEASAPRAAPAVAGTGEAAAGEVMAAREAARSAPDLAALHDAVAAFEGCALKTTARQACPGEGPLGAPLMFVGEAPGREEDETGRPFVGRSGRLLERMLAAIGLAREDVYITNVIPWRPPGNRTPSPIETATCEVFVRREIELVSPRILVPLGGPAAKTLLANDAGNMRQRGKWVRYSSDGGQEIDALAMFHPAYLLRTPAQKRTAWRDLQALAARLAEGSRH